MAATPAITALERSGRPFTVHEYHLGDEAPEGTFGEAVAAALGVPPERVLKTLVATVDGDPVVAIVPSAGSLSTKALARARGGKRAALADPGDAERLTGYVVGGISPFGHRRRLPALVDAAALGYETVFVSAGRRGLQVEVAPGDLVEMTGAETAEIAG